VYLKKITLFLWSLVLSTSLLAGQILVSIAPNTSDDHKETIVEVLQRNKPIRAYKILKGFSSVVISVPYNACTSYRAKSVDLDGDESGYSIVDEFKVIKGKVIPCRPAPTIKEI